MFCDSGIRLGGFVITLFGFRIKLCGFVIKLGCSFVIKPCYVVL